MTWVGEIDSDLLQVPGPERSLSDQEASTGHSTMRNKSMERKVRWGEAVDLSILSRTFDGDYVIPGTGPEARASIEGKDLCDCKREVWIWSAGEHRKTGQILASTTSKFYDNPEYRCLFLR